MAKIRCYAMYGLIGGPFPYGLYYSRGLDVLAEKLRNLDSNIEVPPSFGFTQWRAIVADVQKQPGETRIVIYGHSMGANQALAAAARLGKRGVDLIAAFDPTIWYPIEDLGANVVRAVWFRGTNILSPFGHGRLKAGMDFRGKLERFDLSDRHENIDDNERSHGIVLDAVRALLG
jgi:pimeloyl-ACP methyl ester carboxylesterase